MTGTKEVFNEYNSAIKNLKLRLKESQITYIEIAKGIGLSESRVKKIFSGTDCSFRRLAQICKYIGISLSEIIEDHSTTDVDFSKKQQEEFLVDPLLFSLYWLIVYERLTLSEAQSKLNLNKAETFRLARKLDILGLIKLLPNERLRVPSIRAVRWVGSGKFIHKIYNDWSINVLRDVTKTEDRQNELFIIRYLPMTQKTFSEFKMALRSMEDEFVRRSIYAMKTRPDELKHVRWLVAADDRSFVTGQPKIYD